MSKRISKLIVLCVFIIVVAAISFSSLTVSAAQVGSVAISEKELQIEIKSCLMMNEKTADLKELTYKIASNKVMRKRIKDTKYDLPADIEEKLRQESLEKVSNDSPELTEQLELWQLTRDDIAEIMYNIMLESEIQFRYVQMMVPQAVEENPGITDGYVLVEKIDEYVKAIIDEMPSIEFNQQSVNRISKFAEERHMQIIQ